ncbi:unnamed protein product [Mesocestoides corti]|uniref:Uncharacterized protein n=1 Tax=Mesocestoides corti TaxID=53468 RepID=A0A158QTF8_MESCO|nr:unnamed protein product [Mesocestoides corti]
MPSTKKRGKSSSYLSHDFIIANHGDIVSVIAMVFVGGMLFPVSLLADYSISDIVYTNGRYDILAVFFYTLVCIIIHAVIQEYILDKMSKRLHLPRFNQSKFNESGQLLFFYVVSSYWAIYALINERFLTSLDGLWTAYPHTVMPFWIKVFFIVQLIAIPLDKLLLYSFSKLTIIILIFHYVNDSFFHFARLMKFYAFTTAVKLGRMLSLSTPCLQFSFILTFLPYHAFQPVYGQDCICSTSLNLKQRCFQAPGSYYVHFNLSLNCMMFVLLTQVHMVWTFSNYHFTKIRERKAQQHVNNAYLTNSDLQKRKEKHQKKGNQSFLILLISCVLTNLIYHLFSVKQEDVKESPNHSNSNVKHRKHNRISS